MATKVRPGTVTDKLKKRNRELSILNSIAAALNREVDLSRALQTALVQVADLFDLETAWVFLPSEEAGRFYAAATHNLPPALADHPRRLGGTCYCLDEYRDGDLPNPENITCSRLENLKVGTRGLRFHASIPLGSHGKQLGVLNVTSTDWEEISEEDLELLHLVGDLVSIAIERTLLFNQSAEMGVIRERNRLAREIHDTIAQGLAAIALQLETADALIEAEDGREALEQTVQKALRLTRACLEDARRSVLDLRAAPLEGRTLPEAIAKLTEIRTEKSSLSISFEAIGNRSSPLPVRIASGMYRIAQEALNNVIEHAHAENVNVRLTAIPPGNGESEQIHLIVEDDGLGFDPTQIPKGHYGLIGLSERARLLGGTLIIQSNPGVGTRIEVTIPVVTDHE